MADASARSGRQPVDELVFVVMLREPIARALSSYWFKHSHLFNTEGLDGGSLTDFEESVIPAELEWRERHDVCMQRRYYGGFAGPLGVASGRGGAESNSGYFSALQACFDLDTDTETEIGTEGNETVGPVSAESVSGGLINSRPGAAPSASSFRGRALGLHHLNKGVYHDQLLRWLRVFPPKPEVGPGFGADGHPDPGRSRYCLVYLEQFAATPVAEYRRLLACIGVDVDSATSQDVIHNLRATSGGDIDARKGGGLHMLNSPNTRSGKANISDCALSPRAEPGASVTHASYNEFYRWRLGVGDGDGKHTSSGAVTECGRGEREGGAAHLERIYRRLAAFYAPHNARLSQLLDGLGV